MARSKDATADAEGTQARIERIGFADLTATLRAGWADFTAAPTQIIFLCLIYPILGFILGSTAVGSRLLPLLYPLLAGFVLLGHLTALGIYERSRRRKAGLSARWADMFGVLHSPAILPVVTLGLRLLAAGMALLFVGLAVMLPLLGHATWHLYRWLIA